MKDRLLHVVILAVGIFFVASGQGFSLPEIKLPDFNLGSTTVKIKDVLPEPSADMKAAVQPLIGLVSDSVDKANLSGLYRSMADIVEKDSSILSGTSQVRELNSRAGKLYTQVTGKSLDTISPGLSGSKGGLSTAFEQMMGGRDNKTLDPATRTKCVNAFRALAWAFEQ